MAVVREVRASTLDEALVGFPFGLPRPVTLPAPRRQPAAEVLVERIGGVLAGSGRVLVSFSGGVDSSLVLSAATRAARLGGHPDPVPLTYRFPGIARAEESAHQEHVVEWLGLREWRIEELTDEHDMVGPPALETLAETGLIFPSTLAAKSATLSRLEGELVLTGEGGDEVFGARRVTSARLLARYLLHRDGVRARRAFAAARRDFGPRAARHRLLTRDFEKGYGLQWLRDPTRGRLLVEAVAEDADEPVDPRRYFEHHLSMPTVWVHHQNAVAVRARFGVRLETPLVDDVFISTLAAQVPWHHWTNRREIMMRYFGDLLPERTVNRESKAEFTDVYFNDHCRAFAKRWDGTGLPDEADPGWLKHHWTTAERVHSGTTMLFQMAAMAAEGIVGRPE